MRSQGGGRQMEERGTVKSEWDERRWQIPFLFDIILYLGILFDDTQQQIHIILWEYFTEISLQMRHQIKFESQKNAGNLTDIRASAAESTDFFLFFTKFDLRMSAEMKQKILINNEVMIEWNRLMLGQNIPQDPASATKSY